MAGKINQMILNTHFLFNLDNYFTPAIELIDRRTHEPFKQGELERIMSVLVEREIRGLKRIDRIQGTNSRLFVVKTSPERHPESVKKAYELFLAKCKEHFGNRMIELPASVAYDSLQFEKKERQAEETQAVREIREKIASLEFDPNLTIVRTGEREGQCELNANNRLVLALKEEHKLTVRPDRQRVVRHLTDSVQRSVERARQIRQKFKGNSRPRVAQHSLRA